MLALKNLLPSPLTSMSEHSHTVLNKVTFYRNFWCSTQESGCLSAGIPFPQAHHSCDSDAFIDAVILGEFSFLYKRGIIIYHIVHTNILSSRYIGENFLSPRCPSVHLSSVALSCSTVCDPMDCSMPGFPVHQKLLELAQTHVHQVSDAIQPSHPLSSPSSPAFNLSQHKGLFKWVSSLHQVDKVLELSFSIRSSNEYSGLISFRMDWLNLLALQGTLKSLLQHHRSKASILRCSAFFIVQLSHPYMTTGKTIALIRWTFVGKVVSAF